MVQRLFGTDTNTRQPSSYGPQTAVPPRARTRDSISAKPMPRISSSAEPRISATLSAASREPTRVAHIARGRTAAVRDPSDSDTAGPGS